MDEFEMNVRNVAKKTIPALDAMVAKLDEAIDNMAQFTSIPPFNKEYFYASSGDNSHGGVLEPPHVHIRLNGQRLKFWIAKTESIQKPLPQPTDDPSTFIARTFHVSSATPNLLPKLQQPIIDHLTKHENALKHEWNNYVKNSYPLLNL